MNYLSIFFYIFEGGEQGTGDKVSEIDSYLFYSYYYYYHIHGDSCLLTAIRYVSNAKTRFNYSSTQQKAISKYNDSSLSDQVRFNSDINILNANSWFLFVF